MRSPLSAMRPMPARERQAACAALQLPAQCAAARDAFHRKNRSERLPPLRRPGPAYIPVPPPRWTAQAPSAQAPAANSAFALPPGESETRSPAGSWKRAPGASSEVEHQGGKSSGLQQQVGRAQGLLKTHPWLLCPWLSSCAQIRAPAPYPEQLLQNHPAGRGRLRIECVIASTQAQNRSSIVRRARKASARLVRPEETGPVTSLMAPTGRPPPSSSSTVAMPVAAVSQRVRGTGVSAAGKRASRLCSIWRRRALRKAWRDPIFAFSSL